MLDSRMVTKGYGKDFVAAIPTNRVERFSVKNLEGIIVPDLEELDILKNTALD